MKEQYLRDFVGIVAVLLLTLSLPGCLYHQQTSIPTQATPITDEPRRVLIKLLLTVHQQQTLLNARIATENDLRQTSMRSECAWEGEAKTTSNTSVADCIVLHEPEKFAPVPVELTPACRIVLIRYINSVRQDLSFDCNELITSALNKDSENILGQIYSFNPYVPNAGRRFLEDSWFSGIVADGKISFLEQQYQE